jgi:hypothetical protein
MNERWQPNKLQLLRHSPFPAHRPAGRGRWTLRSHRARCTRKSVRLSQVQVVSGVDAQPAVERSLRLHRGTAESAGGASAAPVCRGIGLGVQLHPVCANGAGSRPWLGSGSMNRLTRAPAAWACAISGASRSASCGKRQPWSLVNWPSASGTNVTCWGRTASTKPMRL